MKYKITKTISLILITIFLILPSIDSYGSKDTLLRDKFHYGSVNEDLDDYYSSLSSNYYSLTIKEYDKKGYKPASGEVIPIDINSTKIPDGCNLNIVRNVGGKEDQAFNWIKDIPWAEWKFDVSSEGLYEIEIEYYMLTGSGNPAIRTLYADGTIPFSEAKNIAFQRMWKDKGEPVINSIGDETRPGQVEIQAWMSTILCDSKGFYSRPFQFYFSSGSHVIRLEFVDQQMVIGGIRIKPAEELLSYTDIKELYNSKGYVKAAQTIEFQAESTVIEKSEQTIRRESSSNPACKPESYPNRKLNVLGDVSWQTGNQSVAWKFSIPQDGLYKIGMRAAQWWNDGLPAFRQIEIDGNIPFKEMEEYKFEYKKDWRTEVLMDSSGEPYLFYLSKGEHTITMTVKLGSLTPALLSLNDDMLLLSDMIKDIIKITGSSPDSNYDYELMDRIPTLKSDMETLIESLQKKYDALKEMSGKLPAAANNMLTIKSQLTSMINDPFSIARRINDLSNAQDSLGGWYIALQEQPLLLDYFLVGAPDEVWIHAEANVFHKIRNLIGNFLISFKKDYDSIGSNLDKNIKVKTVINVWISRGTEWAELIKEMADEDFTPQTGIMVNINVLPASQLNAGSVNSLMLSITSGKAPDVACGVDSTSPVEFAIRNAVYDISGFEDFSEVSKRFLPNIFTPYKYKGNIYAIPETMNFTVVFYRKDIIGELGIKLPDTRKDLYSNVLPVLYQNGLQFCYPVDFTQFIFQHGANFYTDGGKKSGLDTPEAFKAFKECAELYTNYNIPIVSSFFNRMRTGEMPIGIGNYDLYLQLCVAAPELAGKWGIALLPGKKGDDGIVDRSFGGVAGQCDIIMKQSKHPKEAWEFLKWWSSAQTQTRFAREIEAVIGTGARWNTANLEAFNSLSWNREDLEIINEQLKWAKETPVVLGGYFTSRHMTNAWNSVIIGGKNIRDALEQAVEDVNRELRMKQEEYGAK